MRNRFVYGAGGEGHDVGETGGSEEVTLTLRQIPAHTHGINMKSNANSFGNYAVGIVSNTGTTGVRNTNSEGYNEPHHNMPPYIVLYYIEKIK